MVQHFSVAEYFGQGKMKGPIMLPKLEDVWQTEEMYRHTVNAANNIRCAVNCPVCAALSIMCLVGFSAALQALIEFSEIKNHEP